MALSDDQRALLRLLAQREQGYEDIAALKGKSVDEVRGEVREALAAMETPPEPPPPESTSAPLAPEPAPPVAAPQPSAPEPPVPAPETPGPRSFSPPRGAGKSASRSSLPLPSGERRRIVLIAAGALVIVAIVLGAVAVFSGGSDSGSASSAAPGSGSEVPFAETPAATNGKVTRAILEPVDGGDAEGLAVFGRLRKQVRLAVAARGVEQAPAGKAYVLWLANSANRMVPVTTAAVDGSGEIAAQYPIPAAVLVYLAEGAFDEIDISLVSKARYKAAFAKARTEKKLPAYSGSDVLRGKIVGPIVNASQKKGR